MTLPTLLLLIAAILFGLATFGTKSGRFNLVAGGLCLWALSLLLPALG